MAKKSNSVPWPNMNMSEEEVKRNHYINGLYRKLIRTIDEYEKENAAIMLNSTDVPIVNRQAAYRIMDTLNERVWISVND
jgi:hypothetical protein